MKRIIVCAALIGAVTAVPFGAPADPSDSCDLGFLPASTTPAGAGIRIDGAPGRMTVTACNNGSAAPVPGHARVALDTSTPSALVVVDGDPESRVLPCSDGYIAVRASGQGAGLYQSGDGGYTTRARPKNAQEFAGGIAEDCSGVTGAATR